MKVMQRICQQIPATRVIVLSVYEALRDEALSAGACRFLLKNHGRDGLVAAIRLAASGQCQYDLGDMGENDSLGG
jgi:DNA-binding NarL/FixJ family response regulator